jgi:hypothetical protein
VGRLEYAFYNADLEVLAICKVGFNKANKTSVYRKLTCNRAEMHKNYMLTPNTPKYFGEGILEKTKHLDCDIWSRQRSGKSKPWEK